MYVFAITVDNGKPIAKSSPCWMKNAVCKKNLVVFQFQSVFWTTNLLELNILTTSKFTIQLLWIGDPHIDSTKGFQFLTYGNAC